MIRFDTGASAPRLPGGEFAVPFEGAIAWARERRAVPPDEFSARGCRRTTASGARSSSARTPPRGRS